MQDRYIIHDGNTTQIVSDITLVFTTNLKLDFSKLLIHVFTGLPYRHFHFVMN